MTDAFSNNQYAFIYDKFYRPQAAELSIESVERIFSNLLHLQCIMNQSVQDVGLILGEALKMKDEVEIKAESVVKPELKLIDNKIRPVNRPCNPTNPFLKSPSLVKEPVNPFIGGDDYADVRRQKHFDLKKASPLFRIEPPSKNQPTIDEFIKPGKQAFGAIEEQQAFVNSFFGHLRNQREDDCQSIASTSGKKLNPEFRDIQNSIESNKRAKLDILNRKQAKPPSKMRKAQIKEAHELANCLEFDSLAPRKQSRDNLIARLMDRRDSTFQNSIPKTIKNIFKDEKNEHSHDKNQPDIQRGTIIEEKPRVSFSQESHESFGPIGSGTTNLRREIERNRKLREQQNGYACHRCQKVSSIVLRCAGRYFTQRRGVAGRPVFETPVEHSVLRHAESCSG